MTATLFTLCDRGSRKSGFVMSFEATVGAYVRLGEHGYVFVPMSELELIGISKIDVGRELWFRVRREQKTRNRNWIAYDLAVPPKRRERTVDEKRSDRSYRKSVQKIVSPKPGRRRAQLLSMDEKGNGKVLWTTDSKGFSRISSATAYVNIQAFREARFSSEEVVVGLEIEVVLHEADLSWVVNRVFRV
jgi:cold shock CspA family protein